MQHRTRVQKLHVVGFGVGVSKLAEPDLPHSLHRIVKVDALGRIALRDDELSWITRTPDRQGRGVELVKSRQVRDEVDRHTEEVVALAGRVLPIGLQLPLVGTLGIQHTLRLAPLLQRNIR